MRNNSMRVSLLLMAPSLLAVGPDAWADSVTFLATPSAVSGPAGSAVGWGYSITNNSQTDYLDISGIDSDLFLTADGIPDASIFNFPNLAPGQTVVQAYDPRNSLGLFQFTWNSGPPAGTTETGVFTLYGAFCAPTDPFCADDFSVASTALATTPYSATVMADSSTVSEPSGFSLLAILLVLVGVAGGRRLQWPASAQLLRQAIAQDPNFAFADLWLAWALNNLEDPEWKTRRSAP